ncbi:PhzF family phenazine biosynthesis protein [Deinococcus aquaedulcis]|uniref:PhzF family phenazine biosynthesis protein n=1 Tax=Deinococcus aquaedulcis TaxID=2840455 RepID=UPI001C83FA98|nr:PhzF family phenazine biosynthesis protein [Deinococcus aquaedulcis]
MTVPQPLSESPTLCRVFAEPSGQGGKRVAVFLSPVADPQTAAGHSGAPLSVFVEAADLALVHLRVFTPTQEKGSSDSAALAALSALHARSPLSDLLTVVQGAGPGAEEQSAQLCGGEWLLRQGEVAATPVTADLTPLGLAGLDAWVASTGRPNLVVGLPSLSALSTFVPDDHHVAAVNLATGTTGLVLFAPGGPGRAQVSFRAFGPLKGFSEDAASSNMLACLTGVLAREGRLPPDTNLLRAAQCKPGQPARLSAQFAATTSGTEVWVGGRAEGL